MSEEIRYDRTKFETPEYRAWANMKSRCFDTNRPDYSDYGGRGITVCERWSDSFSNFFADMGPRPSSKHSLDRYPNNDGNYEPGNVRWATPIEQGSNKRNNISVSMDGEVVTLAEACRRKNIPYLKVFKRLEVGHSLEVAFRVEKLKRQKGLHHRKVTPQQVKEIEQYVGVRPIPIKELMSRYGFCRDTIYEIIAFKRRQTKGPSNEAFLGKFALSGRAGRPA